MRKMGFSFYVDLHIIVEGELSVREGHRIAHLVENTVLEKLPEISEVLVQVEPELADKYSASPVSSSSSGPWPEGFSVR